MVKVLEIGNQIINSDELIPLLTSYHMLPQVLREMIIDRAIAPITCTREELTAACQHFLRQNQITSQEEHEVWLKRYGMNHEQFQALATRKLRIYKFQRQTWEHKLESYFLKRKKQLDRVIYSLIQIPDPGVAHELYFRIYAGEETFADVARKYSAGPEAHTNGILGPVEMGTLHPGLARVLAVSQPGQLWLPSYHEKYWLILRLEKLIPAQLNEFMRQRLLRELFEEWLLSQ